MLISLLAVDPGCSTGLAHQFFKNHEPTGMVTTATVTFPPDFSSDKLVHGCVAGVDGVMDWWKEQYLGSVPKPTRFILAVELFRIIPAHGSVSAKPEAYSAMWIHALLAERAARSIGRRRLRMLRYTSGTVKGSINDKRLIKAGLWIKGTNKQHERDACRILLCAGKRIRNG